MSARRPIAALATAALSAAAVAGCGSAGGGLIPPASSNALQHDFAEVARAASQGECTGTRELIERTEADFAALPSSVAKPLRERLQEGIENLRVVALARCSATTTTPTATPAAPLTTAGSTTSSTRTTTTTTSSETTSTETEATSTTTHTQTEQQSSTPPPTGGGTPAREREAEAGGTPAHGGAAR